MENIICYVFCIHTHNRKTCIRYTKLKLMMSNATEVLLYKGCDVQCLKIYYILLVICRWTSTQYNSSAPQTTNDHEVESTPFFSDAVSPCPPSSLIGLKWQVWSAMFTFSGQLIGCGCLRPFGRPADVLNAWFVLFVLASAPQRSRSAKTFS